MRKSRKQEERENETSKAKPRFNSQCGPFTCLLHFSQLMPPAWWLSICLFNPEIIPHSTLLYCTQCCVLQLLYRGFCRTMHSTATQAAISSHFLFAFIMLFSSLKKMPMPHQTPTQHQVVSSTCGIVNLVISLLPFDQSKQMKSKIDTIQYYYKLKHYSRLYYSSLQYTQQQSKLLWCEYQVLDDY